MKYINLTRDKKAIVDDEDHEELSRFKWRLLGKYAARAKLKKDRINGKQGQIWMHRVIMKTPKHLQVDHINGNGLDNRKRNMRNCTQNSNQHNSHKDTIKGVTWHKQHQKWYAQIVFNKKHIFLGLYEDKIKAAQAYNIAAKKYFRKYARLNQI